MSTTTLKRQSRHNLKGNYLTALRFLLFTAFLGFFFQLLCHVLLEWGSGGIVEVFSRIPLVYYRLLLLALLYAVSAGLLAPLRLGETHWYTQLQNGVPAGLYPCFLYYSSLRRLFGAWGYCFCKSALKFLISAACLAPSGAAGGLLWYSYTVQGHLGETQLVLGICGLVLFVVGFAAQWYLNLRFALADYFYVAGRGIRGSIAGSIQQMRGREWAWLRLWLSYWWLLATVVGVVFGVPYLKETLAIYAGDMV